MVTVVKKSKVHKISVDKESLGIPDRHAKKAGLAFYKAEKRKGFEPDFELEDWPVGDMKISYMR